MPTLESLADALETMSEGLSDASRSMRAATRIAIETVVIGIDPDEPIPYVLTEKAHRLLDAMREDDQ